MLIHVPGWSLFALQCADPVEANDFGHVWNVAVHLQVMAVQPSALVVVICCSGVISHAYAGVCC